MLVRARFSQVQGQYVVFATVVCVIGGAGRRYFYSRQIEEKRSYPVLQTRLLREVQLSLDTAEALTESDVPVTQVHCDSNTDPGCKSTEHTRMLVGYIQSMGCASWPPPTRTLHAPMHCTRMRTRTPTGLTAR